MDLEDSAEVALGRLGIKLRKDRYNKPRKKHRGGKSRKGKDTSYWESKRRIGRWPKPRIRRSGGEQQRYGKDKGDHQEEER